MIADIIKVATDVASLVLSVAAMFVAVIRTRRSEVEDRFVVAEKKTEERFAEVNQRLKLGSDRMDEHGRLISLADQRIAALPGRDEIHALDLTVTRLEGQLSALAGLTDRLSYTTQRIDDYLRDREK